MATLFAMRDRLRLLTPDVIGDQLLVVFKQNEEVATNLNTDQLWSGKDSQGNDLPEYSQRSVQAFGKPAGPWRLFETGDFYMGFFTNTDRFPIVFSSNDRKTGQIADSLLSKGSNPDLIYGLQKQNLANFNKEYVLEGIKKFSREFLGI